MTQSGELNTVAGALLPQLGEVDAAAVLVFASRACCISGLTG